MWPSCRRPSTRSIPRRTPGPTSRACRPSSMLDQLGCAPQDVLCQPRPRADAQRVLHPRGDPRHQRPAGAGRPLTQERWGHRRLRTSDHAPYPSAADHPYAALDRPHAAGRAAVRIGAGGAGGRGTSGCAIRPAPCSFEFPDKVKQLTRRGLAPPARFSFRAICGRLAWFSSPSPPFECWPPWTNLGWPASAPSLDACIPHQRDSHWEASSGAAPCVAAPVKFETLRCLHLSQQQ